MKKMFTTALGLILGICLLAQVDENGVPTGYTYEDLQRLGNIAPGSPGARAFDNRYEGMKGHPMLFDNWQDFLKNRELR